MHQKQLQQIERRLIAERNRTLRGLSRLSRETGADLEGGVSDLPSHPSRMAEVAGDLMEREKAAFFASKEGRYLYRIEDALRRLSRAPESFGKCHRCGEEIPFDRLDALPHVRFCLDCKLDEEAVEAVNRSALTGALAYVPPPSGEHAEEAGAVDGW